MKKIIFLLSAALIFSLSTLSFSFDTSKTILFNDLPPEAKETVNKIKAGSADWPFLKNDGMRFGNREKRLPLNNKASYKEYTICTESMKNQLKKGKRPNRGKHRIVYDVKNEIYYYTGDHYKTFKKVVFK